MRIPGTITPKIPADSATSVRLVARKERILIKYLYMLLLPYELAWLNCYSETVAFDAWQLTKSYVDVLKFCT